MAVEGMSGEGGYGTDDDEFHAGTCHSYIHAAEIAQEADIAVIIATHKRYYYHITLLTLKTIYGIYRYQMTKGFEKRSSLY